MFFLKAILPICELLVERFLLLITAGRKLFPRTVVAPELFGWLRAPTGQNNFRCQGHLARPSFLHLLHSKITVPDTIYFGLSLHLARWCNAGTSEVKQGVPDVMMDIEGSIRYGGAVGSVLEGLAERDLVS